MSVRRHIAFFAVLVSSTVMFAHAVVPHHHCKADFSICSPLLGIHHAADSHATETEGCDDAEKGCDLSHSIPSLLFILPDNDAPAEGSRFDELLQPLFPAADPLEIQPPVPEREYRFARLELSPASLWRPGAVQGRAPPVLLF